MPRRRTGPVFAAAIAGLLVTVGVAGPAGASGGTRPQAQPAARIKVVAAENFWGSIVQQLAGSHASVTSIITNPAVDPHSYEAKPSDSRAIAGARYVIVNGIGYDPWAQKALDANSGSGQKVLVVGDLLGLKAGDNPHQWYSPESVQKFIDRVTRDLQRLDPRDIRAFDAQRTEFETVALQRYHAVIASIRQRYAATPVGASESIVDPMADSLGLTILTPASFRNAIAEGIDPSAADKETIDQQLKARRIKVFVVNSQNSTPDVQAAVKQAKAEAIPVTTVTETLAPANVTFQAWQVKELLALQAALAKSTGS
jgi:zinc/manganese transport system substrate-binding protein